MADIPSIPVEYSTMTSYKFTSNIDSTKRCPFGVVYESSNDNADKPKTNSLLVKRAGEEDLHFTAHPFGSLLVLACKLRKTENRRMRLVHSFASACLTQKVGSSDHEIVSSETFGMRDSCVTVSEPDLCLLTNYDTGSFSKFPNKTSAALPYTKLSTSDVMSVPNGGSVQNKLPPHVADTGHRMTPFYEGHFGEFSPHLHNGANENATRRRPASYQMPISDRQGKDCVMTPVADSEDDEEVGDIDDSVILVEQRRFRCELCTYQTDNKSHLHRHESTVHSSSKLFQCYVCCMSFSRSERIKQHFLSMHPEIPYKPKFVVKGSLGKSVVTCKPVDSSITLSGRKSDDLIGIGKAVRRSWEKYCRLVAPSDDVGCHFRCLQCRHTGPDIWSLKLHYLDVHSGTRSYACRVCRYSTGNISRFVGHMTSHGELFCYQCSFSTVEMDQFNAHVWVCSGQDALCPICGECFNSCQTVKDHVNACHGRDYCDQCNCVVYAPQTMADHMHTDESRLPDQFTISSSDQYEVHNLSRNFATHYPNIANQTFSCNVGGCKFKATLKKSVDLHQLNYHNESAGDISNIHLSVGAVSNIAGTLFNCPFCPHSRTFKYRKSYEKHLLQHGVDYTKHPYLIVKTLLLPDQG